LGTTIAQKAQRSQREEPKPLRPQEELIAKGVESKKKRRFEQRRREAELKEELQIKQNQEAAQVLEDQRVEKKKKP
jgi:hypothetical protein